MTKAKGKTIQIFLPDGNPRGVKIADITSRTVQTMLIPRSSLEDVATRSEVQSVGVYFLIGSSDEGAKPILYIGEAENCFSRLKQHNKTKDFWNVAIIAVSKTQFFTKSHVKFLEWYCHAEALNADRYSLENNQVPTKPYIPEPVEVDLMDNFDTIKILVSTLGYPIFDSIVKSKQKKDILTCKGKDALAQGEYAEDGLVVFAGSTCNKSESKSIQNWITTTRKKLLDQNILQEDGDVLKFTSNYIFSSPSGAAGTVLGRNANGWIEWKYQDGKTLDEVKRQTGE
nr:GIY-YIG nuclease family protein [uncultured Desulfobulbus sp.]